MLVYSFILLSVIGIFIAAGIFDIKSADYGMLLAAALGFYLLLCAYSAIGTFYVKPYQLPGSCSGLALL